MKRRTRRKITEEMVAEAMENGWSEEDARRGYGIFVSNDGIGAEHIEKIDEMDVFDSDIDAALQAQNDGIKILWDVQLGLCWLDTPEIRELLKKANRRFFM